MEFGNFLDNREFPNFLFVFFFRMSTIRIIGIDNIIYEI